MSAALRIGAEVASALADRRAVVSLETSVIGQGLPHPTNVECARRMTEAVRSAGAVPAWVGVVGGEVVGLTAEELNVFSEPGRADKVARRDLPAVCARGGPGATTVSATIWAAARAGVRVGATGGIGGVHPGERPDVSADLLELARTPGLLVCSGPKSIVDPVATAERLEELGVSLVGYGVDRLPFFLAREADVDLEHRVDTPDDAAAVASAALRLDTGSTILLCNPVPGDEALDAGTVAAAVQAAEEHRPGRDAGTRSDAGAAAALAEATDGRTLRANLALLLANAVLAGEVASALARHDRSG